MKSSNKFKLKVKDLKSNVPAKWLEFNNTRELGAHDGMIGQERAMRAVEIGLAIPTRGYNIFAVGEPGSGKTSTLKKTLSFTAASQEVSPDICYVYNFDFPDQPRSLFLPPGKGRIFAKEMERLVKELKIMIPRILLEGASGHIRAGIVAETKSQIDDLTAKASQVAKELGLVLQEKDNTLHVLPIFRGKPLTEEDMEKVSDTSRKRMEKKIIEFQEKAESFAFSRRQLEIDHDERVKQAEIRAIAPIVEDRIVQITDQYESMGEDVVDFLNKVTKHCIENYHLFRQEEPPTGEQEQMIPLMLERESQFNADDPEILYKVNVFVDRTGQQGAPVVVERMPTSQALCGSFEYREMPGGLTTDHTLLRAGALHQANGGYLLIQAQELLSHENAWNSLKRALRHREIRIDEGMNQGERPRLVGALKPEAVDLDVKVVLVGSLDIYYMLSHGDDNFDRLFKILADFEISMEKNKENVMKLAQFVGQVCAEEGYLPLHRSGVAKIIEFASRQANHKNRLITRQAVLLDLLAEANIFAKKTSSKFIKKTDVEKAIEEKEFRHGAINSAFKREILSGGIIINTAGNLVGQINGIAVYDVGGYCFGTPVRITSRTYVGRSGIVNIDREVNLSGAIHDKGSLILIGYLGGRFALEVPLGFSASITFEQSYDEIDGDSASSAELYALLSSLSGCPINQGIAVTGSVNQLGEIQPIGGVNDKIEGIFDICHLRGLTGDEGVMIPETNVKNLMLKTEVLDAVRKGLFNIYSVSTIDEGIEVLTGIKAGNWNEKRGWEKDSINYMVQERLLEFSEATRNDLPTILQSDL